MTHGKTHNKSPRRINHKATKSKTNTGTTALERSVEQTTGGFKALLPFPYTKKKRKQTKPNKRKSNKRTRSTKISSLFPKRGKRNAQRA